MSKIKLKEYNTNTILDFGKYKGEELGKIALDDPKYISHCIDQENHFCVEQKLMTQIENSLSKWTILFNLYKLTLIEENKKPTEEQNHERLAKLYTNICLEIDNKTTDDTMEF